MKKIILASIIAVSFSVFAQVETPATAENPATTGTVQKTDPLIEKKIEKDFKSPKKKKSHAKKHKKSHGKKHKKSTH